MRQKYFSRQERTELLMLLHDQRETIRQLEEQVARLQASVRECRTADTAHNGPTPAAPRPQPSQAPCPAPAAPSDREEQAPQPEELRAQCHLLEEETRQRCAAMEAETERKCRCYWDALAKKAAQLLTSPLPETAEAVENHDDDTFGVDE